MELGGDMDPVPSRVSSEETGRAQRLKGGQRCHALTATPTPGPQGPVLPAMCLLGL